VHFLEHVTQQIVHAGAMFESQASIYISCFGEIDKARLLSYEQNFSRISNPSSTNIWKLKEKRLEDAWFMLQLVQLYRGMGQLGKQN